jgi:hypothetical protein
MTVSFLSPPFTDSTWAFGAGFVLVEPVKNLQELRKTEQMSNKDISR